MLAMEEHSGDEDLCGLGHQSIIPYVHGRMCCIIVYDVVQALSRTFQSWG
jgi:hypothetical protein